MDYFSPHMSLNEVNAISMLGLAHIGDGVYELLTRTMLCTQGHSAVQKLHRLTVSYVNAPAQAAAVQKILPKLTEAELAVYKRGRVALRPPAATPRYIPCRRRRRRRSITRRRDLKRSLAGSIFRGSASVSTSFLKQ